MPGKLHVVRFAGSNDAVRALEQLLADAKVGRLIGIAYVAMYSQRKYVVDIAGEAKNSPTFTRGMVKRLDDELGAIIKPKKR